MLLNPETGRARPVIFLNLDIFIPQQRIGLVNEAVVGAGYQVGGGVISCRNEAVDAINDLCGSTSALLVGTTAPPPPSHDPRDYLLMLGVRALPGPEWFAYPADTDRRGAISHWLARHGNPVSLVIDRLGVAPDCACRMAIPEGYTLTAPVARQAVDLLMKHVAKPALAAK